MGPAGAGVCLLGTPARGPGALLSVYRWYFVSQRGSQQTGLFWPGEWEDGGSRLPLVFPVWAQHCHAPGAETRNLGALLPTTPPPPARYSFTHPVESITDLP